MKHFKLVDSCSQCRDRTDNISSVNTPFLFYHFGSSLCGIQDCYLGSVYVTMHKWRDYVDLYEKDVAKWTLLRNVNTVMKHSTLLPVRPCVCLHFLCIFLTSRMPLLNMDLDWTI